MRPSTLWPAKASRIDAPVDGAGGQLLVTCGLVSCHAVPRAEPGFMPGRVVCTQAAFRSQVVPRFPPEVVPFYAVDTCMHYARANANSKLEKPNSHPLRLRARVVEMHLLHL
jgi:hypothetical protein